MDTSVKNMCGRCRKRKTCKSPCAFVDEILKKDNHVYAIEDQESIIIYPEWKETQETVLQAQHSDSGKDMDHNLFSTEAENPFASFQPKLDRTHVFLYRFFKGMSYQDIAVMLDTDPERVRQLYKDSVKRLLKALEVMDKRQAIIDDAQARLKISEKASGKLTKTQEWLLLNKLFGLLPREIADIYEVSIKTVSGRIKDNYDRIITGHTVFFDPTDKEIEDAHARIEKKRQRDRVSRDSIKRQAA